MKRKERMAKRAEQGYTTATNRIARQIEVLTGIETRICVPGHMQRGGSPVPMTGCWPPSLGPMPPRWWRTGTTASRWP